MSSPEEDLTLQRRPPSIKEATDALTEYHFITETSQLAKRIKEVSYPIRKSDLDRIEEQVRSIAPQRRVFSSLWPLMGGISATALFSLLGFYTLEKVPPLLWEVGYIVFVASAVLTITFGLLAWREPDRVSGSVGTALKYIESVRSQFETADSNEQT